MTTWTPDIKYNLQVPNDINQLSSAESRPALPLPKTDPVSLPSLTGRLKPLSDTFKSMDPRAVESFAQTLLQEKSNPEDLPLFTSGATCTEDCVADISYLIRTFMPDSVSTQGIGVTTGENIFQGAWAAIQAGHRFNKATKINDTGGMIEGGTDAFRGAAQSLGGAAYLGYRGVMIASDIKHVDTSIAATAPLGKSAFALGTIGNIFFTLFYAALGVWGAYGLIKDYQFSSAMKAHDQGDVDLFKFLLGKIKADPKEKLNKLVEAWKKEPAKFEQRVSKFKESMQKTALNALTDEFMSVQEASRQAGKLQGKEPLSKDEARAVLQLLFTSKAQELRKSPTYANYLSSLGLKEEDLHGLDLSLLELIGFKLEEIDRQSKKEAKFSRVASGGGVEAINKAYRSGLEVRLSADDALVKAAAQTEISALKGRVVEENTTNKKIHAALLVIGIIGLTISILGFIALGPIGAIAVIVLTVALCLSLYGIDFYCMKSGHSEGAPGKYDKLYLKIIAGVLIAALIVSITLTLVFGLPITSVILAGVICGLGLGMIGYSYYRLDQKEKKWKEDHPDLRIFQTLLNTQSVNADEALDEKVEALYKKLPKADRHLIREKYLAMSARGELGFRSAAYKALDERFNFGEEYLNSQIAPANALNEKEHQLFVRAMKKTVKQFWAQWAVANTEGNKQRALKVQALYERVSKNSLQGLNQVLNDVKADAAAFTELKKNLWYVAKRQESKEDLKRVVGAVAHDKAQAAPAVQINPIAERVDEAFQHLALANSAA